MQELKKDRNENGCGVESVLVWHALPGYWLGVDENSTSFPNSKTYYPKFSHGIVQNDPSILREQSIENGIGLAEPSQFYNEYHSSLVSLGIDGVKVRELLVLSSILD